LGALVDQPCASGQVYGAQRPGAGRTQEAHGEDGPGQVGAGAGGRVAHGRCHAAQSGEGIADADACRCGAGGRGVQGVGVGGCGGDPVSCGVPGDGGEEVEARLSPCVGVVDVQGALGSREDVGLDQQVGAPGGADAVVGPAGSEHVAVEVGVGEAYARHALADVVSPQAVVPGEAQAQRVLGAIAVAGADEVGELVGGVGASVGLADP